MGTVRSELAKVAERAKDAQERAADLVHEVIYAACALTVLVLFCFRYTFFGGPVAY